MVVGQPLPVRCVDSERHFSSRPGRRFGGSLAPRRQAPAAVPQVVSSPVVQQLARLGSYVKAVEMELEEALDPIAFLLFVPGAL